MKSLLSPSGMQTAGCFLLPLAVAGALFLSREEPEMEIEPVEALSEELVAEDMKLPQVPTRSPLTGDETAAYESEIARLSALAPVGSPFVNNNRYEHEAVIHTVKDPKREDPVFKLTSVMSAQGNGLCVINQQVRRVGDDLGQGWSVRSIDVAGRSVTVAGPDDRELVLAQR